MKSMGRGMGIVVGAIVFMAACSRGSAQGVVRFANYLPEQGIYAAAEPGDMLTGEEQFSGQLFTLGTGPGLNSASSIGAPTLLTPSFAAGGFILDTLVTLPGVSSGEFVQLQTVYWDSRFGDAETAYAAALAGDPILMGIGSASGTAGTSESPGMLDLNPVVMLPGAVIPEPSALALMVFSGIGLFFRCRHRRD